MLVQVLMGVITAHYRVEGQAFYGMPLAEWLPTQFHVHGIFRLLSSGLPHHGWLPDYIMHRQFQALNQNSSGLGVNFLFGALLVIVVGSLIGQWMGVMQKLGFVQNFWFGHQGYEYVDLGRFWQLFLFVGLVIWLLLMGRAIWPALNKNRKAEVC